jgi:DNA-binding FadR family transcriptional regulator
MANSFQAVTTVRMYRKVADQIIQKIAQGVFSPGARLPGERDLAEQLQVSRASVREALIALELEGFVEVRGGVGVLVLPPPGAVASPASRDPQASTVAQAVGPYDILETRLLLEPDSAALAAHVGLPEQILAIEQAHQAMIDSTTPADHDFEFHRAIAAACGNAALESAILHVWQLSLQSPLFHRLQQHFVTHQVWALACQEHARIHEAIRDRDPVQARHAMHDHLVGILARLRQDFGRSILFQ